ncbi:hypothetical protein RCL_jg15458.t1 [Rhizophagus clarus]|uniref:Uncharacterized protein n=1 Tax=Rhizophagus clarus TaxID=94130 RepID=A0A8H3KNA8_9GLOM|nr:hypothetical protein RCL_jg15458.t1 [Rhizophagus clarus]
MKDLQKRHFDEWIKEHNLKGVRMIKTEDKLIRGIWPSMFLEAEFKSEEDMVAELHDHVITYIREEDKKEIKDLFEFHRVNESCKSRLEQEKTEDYEPDTNNKRKKNREDTL